MTSLYHKCQNLMILGIFFALIGFLGRHRIVDANELVEPNFRAICVLTGFLIILAGQTFFIRSIIIQEKIKIITEYESSNE